MKIGRYDMTFAPDDETQVSRTFDAYAALRRLLDELDPKHRTDTFALQRIAYDRVRAETGLPARLVMNGIREYASGAFSADSLPLDEKLLSFKGADRVSIATVEGRVLAGCLLQAYADVPLKGVLGHLVRGPSGYSLDVPLSPDMQDKEIPPMQTESIPARVSRLAAGLVSTVVESLEAKAPEAVAEQAVREIEKGVSDLRGALAHEMAERKRYEMRLRELGAEREKVEKDVRTAVEGERDDLARVGLGRIDDIETQAESLERLVREADARIADQRSAIAAAEAAARDAAERVRTARRARESGAASARGTPGRDRSRPAEDRIAAALGAVERLTDLPAGKAREQGLDELEEFGRGRRIDDRLAALRREVRGG